MLSFLVLFFVGLLAGAVNAIAGGGTLLTFPALVWIGVPPIMANATATLTALPGYIGSSWAFRNDLRAEGSLGLGAIVGLSAVGGLIGALLLIITPGENFVGIIPWLLLLAPVSFAFGPRVLNATRARGGGTPGAVWSAIGITAVATYGGYFNGGLGIMLLAVLGLIGFENLHGMNGLKNVLSAILSLVSVTTYITAGLIAWEQAAFLALATTAGGYLGARYSRKIRNTAILRNAIVAVGGVLTVVFFFM